MTGPARQWEDWITEQAAAIVRREMAPVEAWENEGGSQPIASVTLELEIRCGWLCRCWWCGSMCRATDLVLSGPVPGKRRRCCMRCHLRDYPEDGPPPGQPPPA